MVGDDVLHAFAVIGSPGEIAKELYRRFGDVVTRIAVSSDVLSARRSD